MGVPPTQILARIRIESEGVRYTFLSDRDTAETCIHNHCSSMYLSDFSESDPKSLVPISLSQFGFPIMHLTITEN